MLNEAGEPSTKKWGKKVQLSVDRRSWLQPCYGLLRGGIPEFGQTTCSVACWISGRPFDYWATFLFPVSARLLRLSQLKAFFYPEIKNVMQEASQELASLFNTNPLSDRVGKLRSLVRTGRDATQDIMWFESPGFLPSVDQILQLEMKLTQVYDFYNDESSSVRGSNTARGEGGAEITITRARERETGYCPFSGGNMNHTYIGPPLVCWSLPVREVVTLFCCTFNSMLEHIVIKWIKD